MRGAEPVHLEQGLCPVHAEEAVVQRLDVVEAPGNSVLCRCCGCSVRHNRTDRSRAAEANRLGCGPWERDE